MRSLWVAATATISVLARLAARGDQLMADQYDVAVYKIVMGSCRRAECVPGYDPAARGAEKLMSKSHITCGKVN